MRRTSRSDPGDARARFAALYSEHGRSVLAYAARRTESAEDAADVVADTFLVAWRRRVELPEGDEARLWLYGVARRAIANQRRGELRRTRLAERIRVALPAELAYAASPPSAIDERVLDAISTLRERDREVLLLSAWEGLTPMQIAQVLGVSPIAVRSRLHRARTRVQQQLTETTSLPAALEPENA